MNGHAQHAPSPDSAAVDRRRASIPSTEPTRDDIASYVYNAGFLQASFSDTQLFLHSSTQSFPTYSLHAFLAARSPRLFEELKHAAGPPYQIHLDADDSNLSVQGLTTALGSLYSGKKEVPAALAIEVLAAANLLQLKDLCAMAWELCLAHFKSPGGLADGIRFLLPSPSPALPSVPTSPASVTSSSCRQYTNGDIGVNGPYPAYTRGALSELLVYLTRSCKNPESRDILLHLPFPLLKQVLESPDLIMSSMERHNFARSIVSARKPFLESGVEESVVMAFGTDSQSGGIEVLKKDRSTARKKALWKASANNR